MKRLRGSDITGICDNISKTGVFRDLCTIQQSVSTSSSSGKKIVTWKTLAGHSNIPCIMRREQVLKEHDSTGDLLMYTAIRIRLNSVYPLIKIGDHAILGYDTWEIYDLIFDFQKTFMVLEVKRWKA
jgi:hypothetical protein